MRKSRFTEEQIVGILQEYPDILVVDNGPELRGRALDGWADDLGWVTVS